MRKFLLFSLLVIALFLGVFLTIFIVIELSEEVSAVEIPELVETSKLVETYDYDGKYYYIDYEEYYEYEKYSEYYEYEEYKNYENYENYENHKKTKYEEKDYILSVISSFEGVSVWFENIETGFSVTYNEDYVYFSASVTKAPLALHVYTLAQQGFVNLDTKLTLTYSDLRGGSGILRHYYNVSDKFTIRRLLGLNLYESDNVATAMLFRYFGGTYRQFLASIGANHTMAHSNLTNSGLSATEAAIFARSIHSFIEEQDTYSEELRRNLLNNRFPFITSSYPVASKTGWTYPLALHDMAIVYAPSPYILVILTNNRHRLYTDFHEFNKISYLFEMFNNRWFSQQ